MFKGLELPVKRIIYILFFPFQLQVSAEDLDQVIICYFSISNVNLMQIFSFLRRVTMRSLYIN